MQRVGIIGAGAWGTALAAAVRRAGRDVMLWALEPEVVASVNERHVNALYLPDFSLDPAIQATGDLARAAQADVLLLVVPAQHLRGISEKLAPHVKALVPVVICAKGIEQGTGALMTEAAAPLNDAHLVVLSGPSFAIEVAHGLPTALTLAASDLDLGQKVAAAIGSRTFRPYLSSDVMGAQVGGAVKNVLAIACGICDGRKLGANARAALLTRGITEIVRLAEALGGQRETLMGLSGLGDLVLTATSMQSRNFSLGVALGQGQSLADILGARRSVTEGVTTADAVIALASRLEVEMPICNAVHQILRRDVAVGKAMTALLDRPFKEEVDS